MRATSRVLRYAAVGLIMLFAVLGAVFAAGYAYADLALGLALALTVGWLALAGGLGWLAWRRPDTAVPLLLGLTVGVAVLSVTDARMDLFDRDATGPVTTVLILAVLVPLAVLALHRTTAAGLFLLVLGVYQVLASGVLHAMAAGEAPWRALLAGSSGVVVVPVLLASVMLLLSGWLAHEPPGSLGPVAHVRAAH